jgi:hypothetical protein
LVGLTTMLKSLTKLFHISDQHWVYGPKDTDTLWSMHGLAYAYNLLNRFADALPLYETVYETRVEV